MHAAVLARVAQADAVIMAAAVADYTPTAGPLIGKLHKEEGNLTVNLRRTPDILGELGRRRAGEAVPILVGFAAETSDVVERARQKLVAKQLDLVVANDVAQPDTGFACDTNAASLVTADGVEEVPLVTKRALGAVILDRIEALIRTPVSS